MQGRHDSRESAANWLSVISPDAWRKAIDVLVTVADVLVANHGTDVHLVCGNPMAVRFHGKLHPRRSWTCDPQGAAQWAAALEHCESLREGKYNGPQSGPEDEPIPVLTGGVCLAALLLLRVTEANQNNSPRELVLKHCVARLAERGCDDFSLSISSHGQSIRIRVAAARSRGGVTLAIRRLPSRIMDLDECGFDRTTLARLKGIATQRSGLVLCVGTVNSGKSSTMAAMMSYGNRIEPRKVVTVEDPVEYAYPRFGDGSRALVQHREVGSDVPDYATGLEQVLRLDAEVVLVGEIRTKQAMQTAIHATQAGHLVYASLHAANAIDALDIIGSFYPKEERENGLLKIARSLTAVIYQALAPSAAYSALSGQAARKHKEQGGVCHEDFVEAAIAAGGNLSQGRRVLIYEYLENTPSVRQLIRQFAVEGPSFRFAAFDEQWSQAPHKCFLSSLQAVLDDGGRGEGISKETHRSLEVAYRQASLAVDANKLGSSSTAR